MPLDYPNERYVRLYRATPDHAALPWQARAMWPLMIQEADGAGLILTSKGAVGVAAALQMPVEIVEAALVALVADTSVVEVATGYLLRNYVEAQTAKMTDTSRKARQRERDRAQESLASHTESRHVTPIRTDPNRSEPNTDSERARAFTRSGFSECLPRGPLPDNSVAFRAAIEEVLRANCWHLTAEVEVPDRGDGRRGFVDLRAVREDARVFIEFDSRAPRHKSVAKLAQCDGFRVVILRGGSVTRVSGIDAVLSIAVARDADVTADERESALRVLERIGNRTGVKYQGSDAHLRLIVRQLRSGRNESRLRAIVAFVWDPSGLGWSEKPNMHGFFRPETLFGPEAIERYDAPALAWLEKHFPEEAAKARGEA